MKNSLFGLLLLNFMTLQISCKSQGHIDQIKSVTAITEVFGDGQKVVAVIVEFDKVIKNSSLSPENFSVEGKTITRIYSNNSAGISEKRTDGKYVIIELSEKDKNAATFIQSGSNHICTWRIAYNIEEVRDWLFIQKM